MFNVFICDDDKDIVDRLEKEIIKYAQNKAIKIETQVFWSCESLVKQLNDGDIPDLLYLDIEFPRMNGVELGKYIRETLRNEAIAIVYISSLQSYAMQLFQIRPLDFLLKPISSKQVIDELEKAMELYGRQSKLFMYHKGHENRRIRTADILFFESLGKEVRVVTKTGEDIFYSSLQTIASPLQSARFFYPHKSFLVNYYQVSIFTYDSLTMSNGEIIPIAQPRRKAVRELQSKFESQDILV